MTNSSEPGRSPSQRRAIKKALFERDGWIEDGHWFCECQFGCGTVLDWDSATIDRYPIPGRQHGRYVVENTRLACGPCNWKDGSKHQKERKQQHLTHSIGEENESIQGSNSRGKNIGF